MKAKEVFSKTLVFGWIKLGLGLLTILIDVLLFALLMGISWMLGSESVGVIMFLIWLGAIGVVNFLLNHYVGYLVKAGHVAVIATAYTEGVVPADPFGKGKAMVKERFGTSNVYFVVDKLVSGSVKQLQRTLGRITESVLGSIPGVDGAKKLMNLFLDISLGYIDECCLGYTFNHPGENAFKSAADGVVVYFKNWKTLLKDGAKTTLTVILSFIAVTLVAFIVFGGLFRMFGWSGFVAFVISLMFAWTVKYAFIDSWILVRMMAGYMQAVPKTEITFDLYGKLCGLSSKFKELWKKSDSVATITNAPSTPVTEPLYTNETQVIELPDTPSAPISFCPSCGTNLQVNAAFCGSCGTKLE